MNQPTLIQLPNNKGIEIIDQKDIISISSDDKVLHIKIENNQNNIIRGTIKKAQEILTHPCLIRCHQRYIINLLKIKEITNKNSLIIMANEDRIPVSRAYRRKLIESLNTVYAKLGGSN